MNNEWKSLVAETPIKVFSNFENYEFRRWTDGIERRDHSPREWLMGNFIEYTIDYRLKPLEPIRMTKELMNFVWDKINSSGGFNIEVHNMCKEEDRCILSIDGRKVEIIK